MNLVIFWTRLSLAIYPSSLEPVLVVISDSRAKAALALNGACGAEPAPTLMM